MPSSPGFRRLLVFLAVPLCLIGATAAAAAGRPEEPGRPVRVAAVAEVAAGGQVATTSPATSTSTSSSTTSSTSTTSTTLKRRPVPTTAPVRPTVPALMPATATPATGAATAAAPASTGVSAEQRCRAAHQDIDAKGLPLPAGWGFRCPGRAVVDGADRWGVACWNCEGAGSWIAVDIDRIGSSDAALRYVVAHESCHAIEYATFGQSTELGADLCAALHGAPRP